MPRPAVNEDTNRAVQMVVNGMLTRQAWDKCGRPGGEAGIQNIQKRAKRIRDNMGNAAIVVDTAAVEETPGSDEKKRASEVLRLNPVQKKKQREHEQAIKDAFDKTYVAATEEWAELVRTQKNGRGAMSADGIADKYRAQLPEGCHRKLTGRSLIHPVQQGRVGKAPQARGKKPAIPDSFVKSIAGEFAQLKQLNGDEQAPRKLIQVAVASSSNTAWETHLQKDSQKRYLLDRVRR